MPGIISECMSWSVGASHARLDGVGDMQDGQRRQGLQARVPQMGGIAGHRDQRATRGMQASRHGGERGQWIFAAAFERGHAIGDLRRRIHRDGKVVLIALCGSGVRQLGQKIGGGQRSHAAEDADARQRN